MAQLAQQSGRRGLDGRGRRPDGGEQHVGGHHRVEPRLIPHSLSPHDLVRRGLGTHSLSTHSLGTHDLVRRPLVTHSLARVGHALRAQGPRERDEVARPDDVERLVHDREAHVGVHGGGAVPREVLAAHADAGAAHPAGERDAVAGDDVGRGAEGPYPDDGVLGLGDDVEHGPEEQVDTGGGEHAAQRTARVQRDGAARQDAEGRGPGQRRTVGRLQPGHVAALLVDGDHQVGRDLVQRRRQRGGGGDVGRVAREVDDAGEAGPGGVGQPVRHAGAVGPDAVRPNTVRPDGVLEPRQEHAVDGAFRATGPGLRPCFRPRLRTGVRPRRRRVGHSFTAPEVRPEARRRWTRTKKIITGTVMMVDAAMIAPQSLEWTPKNERRPIATV